MVEERHGPEFVLEYTSQKWREEVAQKEVFALLLRTIPKGEVARLRREYRLYSDPYGSKPEHPTGGNVYAGGSSAGRLNDISTYNNTRADKQEILDWLQRALELTY